jgi:hypothetical protein
VKVICAPGGGASAIGGTLPAVIGGAPTPRGVVHDLARRRRSFAGMIVHQIHRLDEIAMQRNEQGVVAGELVKLSGAERWSPHNSAAGSRPSTGCSARIGAHAKFRHPVIPAGDNDRNYRCGLTR